MLRERHLIGLAAPRGSSPARHRQPESAKRGRGCGRRVDYTNPHVSGAIPRKWYPRQRLPIAGLNDEQCATTNTELVVDVLEMFLYGVLRDAEVLGYLFIGHPSQKKLENLPLPDSAQTRGIGGIQIGARITGRRFAVLEGARAIVLASIGPTTLFRSTFDHWPARMRSRIGGRRTRSNFKPLQAN